MSAPRGEGLRRLDQEIAGEKAATLGRAGERLEQAIQETHTVAARLLAARGEEERERLAHEYTAARTRAIQARVVLMIQREALGLRRHTTVDQQFPEPPSLERLRR